MGNVNFNRLAGYGEQGTRNKGGGTGDEERGDEEQRIRSRGNDSPPNAIPQNHETANKSTRSIFISQSRVSVKSIV